MSGDVLARAFELIDLINTNAANSVSGFGRKDNRRQIYEWSGEAARLIHEARATQNALRDLLSAASLSATTGKPFAADSPGIVAARAALRRVTGEQA